MIGYVFLFIKSKCTKNDGALDVAVAHPNNNRIEVPPSKDSKQHPFIHLCILVICFYIKTSKKMYTIKCVDASIATYYVFNEKNNGSKFH